MRRRKFITLLGGAVAAWPRAARAQQRTARIAALMNVADNLPERAALTAFRQGLKDLGWIEGGNVQIDERWAAGDSAIMQSHAADLVNLRPDVILARGSRGLAAIRSVTRTIPTVFVGLADPIGLGFVESLARPGSNITGFTNYEVSLVGKLLEMLKQVAPSMARVLFMYHPDNLSSPAYLGLLEAAARLLGVTTTVVVVRSPADIEQAIQTFAQQPNGGLIMAPDAVLLVHVSQIIALAERYRLPAVYAYRNFPISGGLMSYGVNIDALFRQAASYVDRILKGTKPAELPVQAPTTYQLVINLKTAKALGLTVPLPLLAFADEVIE